MSTIYPHRESTNTGCRPCTLLQVCRAGMQGFQPLRVTVRCVQHLPTVKVLMVHGANQWHTDHQVSRHDCQILSGHSPQPTAVRVHAQFWQYACRLSEGQREASQVGLLVTDAALYGIDCTGFLSGPHALSVSCDIALDLQGESSIYIAEQAGLEEALQLLCNQNKLEDDSDESWASVFLRGASSIEASVRWLGKKLSPTGSLR